MVGAPFAPTLVCAFDRELDAECRRDGRCLRDDVWLYETHKGHLHIGERESRNARLGEALAAYSKALKEWTRDRVPYQWATTLDKHANVEAAFGDKTGDKARHRAAIAHGEAALDMFKQPGAANYVAMAQGNLARIRGKLGR